MLKALARLRPKTKQTVIDTRPGEIKSVAVLHLDIVGSTQLVRDNMLLAHRQIQHLYTRICRICRLHQCTARELRGDAAVVEFESATDALRVTLAIHSANSLIDNTRMGRINPEIRTGISFGPVISDAQMITGEAVIRAQRVEQLAEPGELLFDQSVADQLEPAEDIVILPRGAQTLKGFKESTMIYEAVNSNPIVLNQLQDHFRSLAS